MSHWDQFVSEKAQRDAGKVMWLEALVHDLETERNRLQTAFDRIAVDPAEYRHALGHVANCDHNCEPCRDLARQALDGGVDAQKRAAEILDDRTRLRAVVRKLVEETGIAVAGKWLTYAFEEGSTALPFDAEELAAYQRALDGPEATDG
jgi:hypothetical protein